MNAQVPDLGVHSSLVCESLLLRYGSRVAIRIRLASEVRQRTVSVHADEVPDVDLRGTVLYALVGFRLMLVRLVEFWCQITFWC
jgi:hypothetical protein